MRIRPLALCSVAWLAACASDSVPHARFVNAPPATIVDDRRDVPQSPASRRFGPDLYAYDGIIHRRLIRTLELPRPQRALGTNAIDEVPDSTWFTNRVGQRDLTPDEIRNGPLTVDSPEHHLPWTVRSTKVGGTSPGFVVKDARGIKYMVKFDDKGYPDIETGTHVIVNRLLWAAGYNVAEDDICYVRESDFAIAPDAVHKRLDGSIDGKLDREELHRELGTVEHQPDGRMRVLVSRWIDGTTLGGHPAEGVRDDDPNDRIPHELRRDLRGAYAIFAWLDHVDVQESNYVDSWQTDPADRKRHYVVHYLIDFGKSLGAMGLMALDWRRGHVYEHDLRDILRGLVTLGLADEPWRHRDLSPPETVGLYDAKTFDPGDWHPDFPAYVPFLYADRFDKFWGARIVARFTRAQLEAAVDAGRFTPPAAKYLVDMLVERQRITAAYWFARVNPLAGFTTTGGDLCFDDLAIAGAYAEAGTTRYHVDALDWLGRPIATPTELDGGLDGHACVPQIGLAPISDAGGYTIVRVRTTRPDASGETYVHVARDPATGAPRVVGLWRT